ncbi:hypothetical protein [Vibrio nigripulchritudo]|uniref:hypothetical protein n=1 Tax=Vibrio nigripulchritudo TaxID=28173 RepID=UPI0003B1A75B|nr:hypothetical protein [Vibrio nigripulchritudo]CCN72339.1 hypothetical protein VIBNISFn118_550043 [Vibrio nigripulchritudo SFn118]
MAEIHISTVMLSIQAIEKQIEHFERLLDSDTVRDKDEIEDLLLSLDRAAENLKEVYFGKRSADSNFPTYEQLVEHEL